MPRDGLGLYSIPPGTDGIPDQTVESTKYNIYIHDVETDLNTPRPIVAGGTGASNGADAIANLGGEVARQVVSNYDATPFLSGSFYSQPSATGGPIDGHYFVGSVVAAVPANTVILHAYDFDAGGAEYVRVGGAGGWGPWTGPNVGGQITAQAGIASRGDLVLDNGLVSSPELILNAAGYPGWYLENATGNLLFYNPATTIRVSIEGLTGLFNVIGPARVNGGVLTVAGDWAQLVLSKPTSGTGNLVVGNTAAAPRWQMFLGNQAPETGGDAGSDFLLHRVGDGGAVTAAFGIARSDGFAAFYGGLSAAGALYGGPLDLTTGANTHVQIKPWTVDPSYNALSLSGDVTATMVGLAGGSATDKALYYNVPATFGHYFRVANTTFVGIDQTHVSIAHTVNSSSLTTGALTVAGGVGIGGNVNAGGNVAGTGFVCNAPASLDAAVYLRDEVAAVHGSLSWVRATGMLNITNAEGDQIVLTPGGKVALALGYAGRSGIAGGLDGNTHNFYWNGTANRMWIDGSDFGSVTVSCDYRIKKSVVPLRSTWEAIKRLRPIVYTQAEYTPPGSNRPLFLADEVWRWGFIAHELQDALLPSAAHGTKDSPTEIQSPNLLAIVAALTRALQEAMARIEVLELSASTAAAPR